MTGQSAVAVAPRWRVVSSQRLTGLLLVIATFGLFAFTDGNLVGYEPETVAVTEGLVRAGELRVAPGAPFAVAALVGRDGYGYSRVGLTQPLLEAPVYWLGAQLDGLSSTPKPRWRLFMVRLFDPAMAALTVLCIFALLMLRGVSERKALGVAGLGALATLIWPYSKMGMDTTSMAMLALAMTSAAWAARRPAVARWALAGVAAALTVNAKPYAALLLVGVLPLLAPAWRRRPAAGRVALLGAFLAPVLVGVLALGWYNWYRTGSVTNFLDPYSSELLATPINALGLFLSPGKGLLWYSPLVILGLIAMRVLWRVDRPLALACLLTVAANTLVIASSSQWGDETWGPRYLVPSAWLLILPLAWWVHSPRQMRWLIAVGAIGAVVQLVAVIAPYYAWIPAARTLAGAPVYPEGATTASVPYGDDGPRWIPEVSPLVFQTELVLAELKQVLTGSGFFISYTPYRGHPATIDLRHPDRHFGPLPDFWWDANNEGALSKLFALVLAAATATTTSLLIRPRRRTPSDSAVAAS